jgi:hypothetical protein
MNLLPAVEAYIAERRAHLLTRPSPPFETLRELASVAALCQGLSQQSELMDKLLEAAPALKFPPLCDCDLNETNEHRLDCPLHPRNLTKL